MRPKPSWDVAFDRLSRAEPRAGDRIFFLLYPSRAAAEKMHRIAVGLCERFKLAGCPPAAERLHVSLLYLCEFRDLTAERLGALAAVPASLTMPAFLAGFDRVLHFGRTRGPLVLCGGDDGIVGIRMLRSELADAMRLVGWYAKSPGDMTPHVTLNYRSCAVPEETVEEIRWRVSELVLVCSLRGRRRHVPLGRWPLHGGLCEDRATNPGAH